MTWTADPGVSVGPGQFQQFVLSAGPLPEQDAVEFPVHQTYSDGNVVQWDQKPGPDGSEPDKPAPSLTLAAGSGDGHGTVDATVSVDETTTPPTPPPAGSADRPGARCVGRRPGHRRDAARGRRS